MSFAQTPKESYYPGIIGHRESKFSFGITRETILDRNVIKSKQFKINDKVMCKFDRERQPPIIKHNEDVALKNMFYKNKTIKDVNKEIEDKNKAEMERRKFKEDFSKLPRDHDTRILGGGPVYPIIPNRYDNYIVDLD